METTGKQYKRVSKHPSEDTKQRIATALTGRHLNMDTKQKISKALSAYWNNPANFPADRERHEGTGRGWVESGGIV